MATLEQAMSADLTENEMTSISRLENWIADVYAKDASLGDAPKGEKLTALARQHYANIKGRSKLSDLPDEFAMYLNNRELTNFGLRKDFTNAKHTAALGKLIDQFESDWVMLQKPEMPAPAAEAAVLPTPTSETLAPATDPVAEQDTRAQVAKAEIGPENPQSETQTASADIHASAEPTVEASGDEAREGARSKSVFAPVTTGMLEALNRGDTGAGFIPFTRPSLAAFLAAHPGFMYQKSFVDAITAEAKKYGLNFEQYMDLTAGGIHELEIHEDGRAIRKEKIDAGEKALEILQKTAPNLFPPKDSELGFEGFMHAHHIGQKHLNFTERSIVASGKSKLVMIGKNGNLYVDNGTTVKTILADKKRVDNRIIPMARYSAVDALNETNIYFNNRLSAPNQDGSPREMNLNIKPVGLDTPARMMEVRDLSIIAALHEARENDLKLNLNVISTFLTPDNPQLADGTIDFDKLSPHAKAAMATRIGNVEELVNWFNARQLGNAHVELDGDQPTPQTVTPAPNPTGPSTPPVELGVTPSSVPDNGVPVAARKTVLPQATNYLKAVAEQDGLARDTPIVTPGAVYDDKGQRVFGGEKDKYRADKAEDGSAHQSDVDPIIAARATRRPAGPGTGMGLG